MTGSDGRSLPDTQWPRWEVFKQDAEGKPHQAVGSVHAADAEHALLMARSVHVRRPAAASLWVAPADAVYAVTAEQLTAAGDRDPRGAAPADASRDGSGPQRFLVFRKTSHRRSMTFVDHVGEVDAPGPEAALAAARVAFPDPPALAWWVVPASQVVASPADEAPAWFDPARSKTYKQQSEYGTLNAGQRKGERS
ncbi:MAG TPA: phenylacetic acid degradation protein [Trueperaceae bacterium]|nr:phenylacetic acid degradation protein [Trueperaceae bacterium]